MAWKNLIPRYPLELLICFGLTLVYLVQPFGWQITLIELIANFTGIWSVRLLSDNNPLGWWVGLVMVALFGYIFWQVQLYGEVGIQVFYFFTSLQALWIWHRGGFAQAQRPVGVATPRQLAMAIIFVIVGTLVGQQLLSQMGGASPFWDALSTVLSLTAHVLLMYRLVDSWPVWFMVDIIYIPLYASRGLFLTSLLYVYFLWRATQGLKSFKQEIDEQSVQVAKLQEL